MEECLTCTCGCQSWTVYADRIECDGEECSYVMKIGAFRIDVPGLNKGLAKSAG